MLEGYRARDAGEVRVLGHDPGDRPVDMRARVGIVLQSCGTYPHLTVRETVEHWASLYPAPRRVDEVLALAGLDDCAARRARTLSGGQARRLDFALALVGDPELIFLDEPTTGFDPAARRAAWDVVRALRDLGKTVVLTTHYLDEAQALADRVAILQDGLILAEGPPHALGASRYRVAWRAADGTLEERFTEDPTALLRDADRRGAGARRAAGGPERHAPEPRGRVPRADRGRRLIAAAWRQYRLERRMFWRNPSAAFFGVVLPLGLLAIFGAVFAGREEDLDVIVPGIAGLSIMSATFTSLAYNLTTLRERGILKRLRGTPLPTSAYLGGLAGNAIANAALQLVIVIVSGSLLLGVTWPQDWLALAVFARRGRGLLHVARRRARARDPEPRVRPRVRQRGVPAADPDRGRLLRRRRSAGGHPRHRAGAASDPPR